MMARAPQTVAQALNALVGNLASIEAETSTAWRTISFSGERHRVQLRFEGIDAAIEGEALIAELGATEVHAIGRHTVADIEITGIERAVNPLCLTVWIAILTLDMAETA